MFSFAPGVDAKPMLTALFGSQLRGLRCCCIVSDWRKASICRFNASVASFGGCFRCWRRIGLDADRHLRLIASVATTASAGRFRSEAMLTLVSLPVTEGSSELLLE